MENASANVAAEAVKAEERELFFEFPLCPGCHIQCDLADPQCGRGLRFHDAVLAGEELPKRGMPPKPGKGSKDGHGPGARITADQRLSFLLGGVMPNIVGKLQDDDDKIAILSWLLRQEGAMTYGVMPERAHVDADALYGNLEQMLEMEWIEERYTDWGTQFYWISKEGIAVAQQEEEARAAKFEELFSVYSEDEKDQLIGLLERLIRRPRKIRLAL